MLIFVNERLITLTMNKQKSSFHALLLCISVCFLAISVLSCINHIDEDEPDRMPATLTVTTRSASPLPYPLQLYAFDVQANRLAAKATIDNKDAKTSLSLTEGNYRLVALGGTEDCSFPESPSPDDVISLPETNYARHALMLGSAIVNVSGDATAEIRMSYCMTSISLSLTDIPKDITSVNVLFSPLYSTMDFSGNYAGSTTVTTACTQENDVWKASTFYTFPGSGQQTLLSIEMTGNNGKKQTYGYTYNGTLKAGTPYNLSGSYKQGFTVNGNITADGWNAPEDITFTFGDGDGTDPGGSDNPDPGTDANGNYIVNTLPTARNMWNGHYVTAVQNKAADGTSADLLLLSLKEWQDVASANTKTVAREMEAADYVAAYTEAGIPGWSIPTTEEAKLIKQNCGGSLLNAANVLLTAASGDALTGSGKDNHNEDVRYLCENAAYSYELKALTGSITQAGETRTYYLRAVKTVHVVLSP